MMILVEPSCPYPCQIIRNGNIGNLSLSQLEAQMVVLNEAYSGLGGGDDEPDTRIRFELRHYHYIESATYAKRCCRPPAIVLLYAGQPAYGKVQEGVRMLSLVFCPTN